MAAVLSDRVSKPERVDVSEPGRLLDTLAAGLPGWKRSTLKTRLRHGAVRLNGEVVRQAVAPVAPGDVIEIGATGVPDPPAGIRIVHLDEALVVIVKPEGLLSVPGGSERTQCAIDLTARYLRERRELGPKGRLWAVHRLDRETSGLMMFARSREVEDRLRENWRQVEKTYLAITEGVPSPAQGEVNAPLRERRTLDVVVDEQEGRPASTRFSVLEHNDAVALLEVDIASGHKHQIRVHLLSLGHPIVGDRRYGAALAEAGRMCLHSTRLAFVHPNSGEKLTFTSPRPPTFDRAMTVNRPRNR